VVVFGVGRRTLAVGKRKINLHQEEAEFVARAQDPTPGSAELCLLTETLAEEVIRQFGKCGTTMLEAPVKRTAATGPIRSVYFHDPDGNLIEVSNQTSFRLPHF
jgi:catechol 2,3-dioxygenase-like lactoylglutathione lyase family enzyme